MVYDLIGRQFPRPTSLIIPLCQDRVSLLLKINTATATLDLLLQHLPVSSSSNTHLLDGWMRTYLVKQSSPSDCEQSHNQ